MTLWRPDPALVRRPAYLSLAEQIARAIHDGRLQNGSRLPTHRRMAEDLGLSVQTVSRAYEELIRRGLVSGEIGRGSFVQTQRSEPAPPYLPERPGEVIDLSILKPVSEKMHLDRLKQALGWLSENLPASSALSFRPNMVFPRHRAVAVEWLKRCGLSVQPQNVSVTNGATAGMTVALMSVAPPGSTVAAEAICHHTLVPLATYLGFKLEGLAIDGDGLLPEALDAACGRSDIRAVFVQPSVINPTATLMSEARRQAIVAVARKHDIAIIERRRARPADRGSRAAVRLFRAGAHALRYAASPRLRYAGLAHRLSRRAGPLRCRGRQPPSRVELDGDADGRRDRLEMGDRRHRYRNWWTGSATRFASATASSPRFSRASTTWRMAKACMSGCRWPATAARRVSWRRPACRASPSLPARRSGRRMRHGPMRCGFRQGRRPRRN